VSQEQILKEAYKSFAPLQQMHYPDTKYVSQHRNEIGKYVLLSHFKDKEIKKETWRDLCQATESWC